MHPAAVEVAPVRNVAAEMVGVKAVVVKAVVVKAVVAKVASAASTRRAHRLRPRSRPPNGVCWPDFYFSFAANFCRSFASLGGMTALQYGCVGCSA